MKRTMGGADTLNTEIRALEKQWNTTCEIWQDNARNNFARDYIDPLLKDSKATMSALEELIGILREMSREI